ncbi:O-methyltransferase [Aspergillus coremiiformis]|uniref:O-methyltransferase n=1 Tax=Aspergillus coremiiformis TaxID=138285 RepID=A0A5N6Z6Y4_9EURO|nr:O-methyltransferase [Aspergillus coremiiformis]
MSSLTDLATRIASNASVLDNHLKTNQFKAPSFDAAADSEFPNPEHDSLVEAARVALIDDTKALRDLAQGPAQVLRELCWGSVDLAVQHVIYRFKIYDAIPLEGSITYAEVANKIALPERQVERLLRQSILHGIFTEPELGRIAHTASSAVLIRDKSMLDWYGYCVEELFPTSAKLADSLEANPASRSEQCAFNKAFDTEDSFFTFLENHPHRQARFVGAMLGVAKNHGHSLTHVVRGYDWAKLGQATVVDVGGSSGFVSVALAVVFPDLRFVVQDYKHIVEQGRSQLPASLTDRVDFVAHNFFDPQLTTADVYILRHICHNWSDADSAQILRQIVPAMKPTSRVLLVEAVVVPPKVVDSVQERYMRTIDIVMMQFLNAQERSAEDWEEVVSLADPRLQVLSIHKPPQSWDSIIEIGFRL